MNTAFVDTNILLDLLLRREPFYPAAAALFSHADRGNIKLYISALTVANTNYIAARYIGQKRTRTLLVDLLEVCTITPLDSEVVTAALKADSFTDVEDAMQYFMALRTNAEVVTTRDPKGFKNSQYLLRTADEFLQNLDL